MNLGFITDLHMRGDIPEGRTDDFRLSLYEKLEEAGQIWLDNNVDYILCGGDWFHTPDPSMSIVYDMIHILKSWKKDIIGIIGSHDYFGYQIKSLKRTAVGLLQKSEIINLIGGEGFQEFITLNDRDNDTKVNVIGIPHTYWLADTPNNLSRERLSDDLQIQLVHGDLVPNVVSWQHILIEKVLTSSDIVLSGHYHPGWKNPMYNNNVMFINPGSFGRVENSNRIRLPRVCIIKVMKNRKFNVNYVTLTKAKEHPFKEKEISEDDVSIQDITYLLQKLQSTQVEMVNIKEQLPLAAKDLGYGEDVIEKAFEILEKVKLEN